MRAKTTAAETKPTTVVKVANATGRAGERCVIVTPTSAKARTAASAAGSSATVSALKASREPAGNWYQGRNSETASRRPASDTTRSGGRRRRRSTCIADKTSSGPSRAAASLERS